MFPFPSDVSRPRGAILFTTHFRSRSRIAYKLLYKLIKIYGYVDKTYMLPFAEYIGIGIQLHTPEERTIFIKLARTEALVALTHFYRLGCQMMEQMTQSFFQR